MTQKRPVRALILTSIRDVGECDKNGVHVPTSAGFQYMMGLTEYAVRACDTSGELHGFLEIAGVVTDDLPANLEHSAYPLSPTQGRQWIHPLDLEDHRGRRIADLTVRIPSLFRKIPCREVVYKREAKRCFELKVLEHMRCAGADIIISDHCMVRIDFLISEDFGLYGKVLNIHPAVTDKRHPCCFRGPTPTADAITRAKTGVDTVTGATLHYVNDVFDDGPIIECQWPTPVHAHDSPAELRWRNYRMAKFPVFVTGMQKYVTELF